MEPKTQRKTRPKLKNFDSVNTIKKVNIFAKILNPLSKFLQNCQNQDAVEQVKKNMTEKSNQINSTLKVIKRTSYEPQPLPNMANIKQSWQNITKKLSSKEIAQIQNAKRQNQITQMIESIKQKLQYCQMAQYTELKMAQFQIQVLELIKFCQDQQSQCAKKRDQYKQLIQENQKKKEMLYQLQKIQQNIQEIQNQKRSVEDKIQEISNEQLQLKNLFQQMSIIYQQKVQDGNIFDIQVKQMQDMLFVKKRLLLKQKFQIQLILEQNSFIGCYNKYKKQKIKSQNKIHFKYYKQYSLKQHPVLLALQLKNTIQLGYSLYFFLKTCFLKDSYQILTSLSYSTETLRQIYEFEKFIEVHQEISKNLKQKAMKCDEQEKLYLSNKFNSFDKLDTFQQSYSKFKSELQVSIVILTKFVDLTMYFLQIIGCRKIFEKEQQNYFLVNSTNQNQYKLALVIFQNQNEKNSECMQMQSIKHIFKTK